MPISDAILKHCRSTWRKAARVVWSAHRDLGLTDDEASYDVAAAELIKYAYSGKLETVGDLSDWRQSELQLTVS
jgi:hypothetical protein